MIWVIDTSALIRLFVPDGPLHSEVESAINRAASGSELILAPDLLLIETANAFLRKQRRGELSSQEVLGVHSISLPFKRRVGVGIKSSSHPITPSPSKGRGGDGAAGNVKHISIPQSPAISTLVTEGNAPKEVALGKGREVFVGP